MRVTVYCVLKAEFLIRALDPLISRRKPDPALVSERMTKLKKASASSYYAIFELPEGMTEVPPNILYTSLQVHMVDTDGQLHLLRTLREVGDLQQLHSNFPALEPIRL